MRTLVCWIALMALPGIGNCQTVVVQLQKKYGVNKVMSYYKPTIPVKVFNHLKNIDTLNCEKWEVRQFTLFPPQEMREKLQKGVISEVYYNKYVALYNIDTTLTTRQTIPHNLVYSLIKIDSNKTKHIKVDANNNFDFSDDSWIHFGDSTIRIRPVIDITFDYFDGRNILRTSLPLTLDIYENNGSETNFYFLNQRYWEGQLSMSKTNYAIQIDDKNYGLYPNNDFLIRILSSSDSTSSRGNYKYRSNDLIVLDDKKGYHVDTFSNGKLILNFAGQLKHDNGRLNTIAPEITATDMISEMPFSLLSKRGQYVILDFWGTWCKPCLEMIPSLVDIAQKYKTKGVHLVSIAYDKKEDLPKLKSIIENKKMVWAHIFNEMDLKESIVKSYLVQQYPTTMLISPTGVVLVRGEGDDALRKIDDFLSTH